VKTKKDEIMYHISIISTTNVSLFSYFIQEIGKLQQA